MESQQQLSSQDQQQLKKMKESLILKRKQTRKKLLENEYPFQIVLDVPFGMDGYLNVTEYNKLQKTNVTQQHYLQKIVGQGSYFTGYLHLGNINTKFDQLTQMPKRTDHYLILQQKISHLQKEPLPLHTESYLQKWTFRFQFQAGCKTLAQVLEWHALFSKYIASPFFLSDSDYKLSFSYFHRDYNQKTLKEKCKYLEQKCIYTIHYKDHVLLNTEEIKVEGLLIARYLDVLQQEKVKPLRINQKGNFVMYS